MALIWDITECDGQLKQLILKESLIIDSLIDELRNDLIDSRLKTPKDIHRSVTKFIKTIDSYLSVCRLTCSISDDQFIDELLTVLNNFDTKGTNFFVSTLLTSILMFKFKSRKMKLILWSNDVNKLSIISQLLVVINQFLKPKTKKISYLSPQLKSIKFCRNLSTIKRTSSVTPITKSIISERKSRDESLGYESLTESGSTTTSTICDYSGFASRTLDTSTPLEQSLEQSIERLNPELVVDSNEPPTDGNQSSSQLNKSRNYFREYRNLRFTPNQLSDEFYDEETTDTTPLDTKCQFNEDLSDADSQHTSDSFKSDEFGTDSTDVEEIHESHLLSGFGQISMPELIPDSNQGVNESSLSQSPTISDTYLSQMSIQGIINSKTITSFEDLMSDVLKRSSTDLNDNTIIVCDCDLWRINYVESSRSCPAIMSSTIGNLCETITEMHSLGMNSLFIRQFIDNRINELAVKSIVVKSLIEDNCVDNQMKRNLIKMFGKETNQSLLPLIADNYLFDFSPNDCLSLGFDISDIPVIIALNRQFLSNNYNNCKNSDRNETHFVETIL